MLQSIIRIYFELALPLSWRFDKPPNNFY